MAGAAAALLPLHVRAQGVASAKVGFLHSATAAGYSAMVAAVVAGLNDAGYVEGRNLAIEYRWANNDLPQLPRLAAELVQDRVDVFIAAGGDPASFAAKSATATIPIVFVTGSDPVKSGVVTNLNRPGGNVTGVTFFTAELQVKRLDILRELIPKAQTIAFLNTHSGGVTDLDPTVVRAIEAGGQTSVLLHAENENDLQTAFETAAGRKADAILLGSGPLFTSLRDRIVALAARYRLPTVYPLSDYVVAGGLVSYGADISAAYRQGGLYAGQILNGEKPADLPVLQPSKFTLAINLKAARALGLALSPMLVARADQVIE